MELMKYLGFGLIILSSLSGLALYVDTFIEKIDNITALSWLFVLSLIGGVLLYCLGDSSLQGIVFGSYILLILGCLSAATIFLAEINLFAVEYKTTLWVFFLICTPIGVAGIYHEKLMMLMIG
jgi:hypothetical protein